MTNNLGKIIGRDDEGKMLMVEDDEGNITPVPIQSASLVQKESLSKPQEVLLKYFSSEKSLPLANFIFPS